VRHEYVNAPELVQEFENAQNPTGSLKKKLKKEPTSKIKIQKRTKKESDSTIQKPVKKMALLKKPKITDKEKQPGKVPEAKKQEKANETEAHTEQVTNESKGAIAVQTSDGSVYEIASKDNGFERGLEVEEIVGTAHNSFGRWLLVKWKGEEKCELVPAQEINERCPQQVIAYYQARLQWDT
jgi:hypothetical protein